MKKVIEVINRKVAVWVATQRMRVGIKAAKVLHKKWANDKTGKDTREKNIRNYIVLLELPVRDKTGKFIKKDGKVVKKERLFWINRRNFQRIKHKGWLPKNMQLPELKQKAFYYTDFKRSYAEEYQAKERAKKRYISYIIKN